MTSYAHPVDLASPWGCCQLRNCWHVRELLQRGDVIRTTRLDLASPWGAANCATAGTAVNFWEAQRSHVVRTPRLDLVSPWGAANCATGTFVSSREAQRSAYPD